MSQRMSRARRRASSYSRRLDRHLLGVPDLGEEFADDLPELFLRDLLFDVFVRAVEVRRIGAEAVGAEERADEDDARVRERRIGLDLFGHFDAELALEIDVDDDQVGARAADELERRLAGLEVRRRRSRGGEDARRGRSGRGAARRRWRRCGGSLRQRRVVQRRGPAGGRRSAPDAAGLSTIWLLHDGQATRTARVSGSGSPREIARHIAYR